MSPIRHARRSRLAAAGAAVTGAALLAAALTPTTAGAADRPTRAAAIDAAASVLAERAEALGLTAAQRTKVRDVVVDADGSRHVRYDRTYRGLPVLGGDFVLHLAPDGSYQDVTRATRAAIDLPTVSPRLAAPRAADLAANLLRAAHLGETLNRLTARPQLVVDALHGAPASPGAPTPPPRTPPATRSPAPSSPTPTPAPASTPGTGWRASPATGSPCTAARSRWRPRGPRPGTS